jgi:hypothetical protein
VLLDPLDGGVAQLQTVGERLLLVGGLVAQFAGVLVLVDGLQVRVEHLDEVGQFVGGFAAEFVGGLVVTQFGDVLTPKLRQDFDVGHLMPLRASDSPSAANRTDGGRGDASPFLDSASKSPPPALRASGRPVRSVRSVASPTWAASSRAKVRISSGCNPARNERTETVVAS